MSGEGSGLDNLQIPELEKKNVKQLRTLLDKAASDLQHKIKTSVVGGTISKPWPRKDIDLLCSILDLQNIQVKGSRQERATESLGILEQILRKAIGDDEEFKIQEIVKPFPVGEFRNPNILEHYGTIVVQPINGSLIELINDPNNK